MTSICVFALWCLSVMQRLTSWQKPALPSAAGALPRTRRPLLVWSDNWRPLTSTSSGPAARYLVRRVTRDHLFYLYVHDIRTTLTWRCDFFSQHERNTYLNELRSGFTATCPPALVDPASR